MSVPEPEREAARARLRQKFAHYLAVDVSSLLADPPGAADTVQARGTELTRWLQAGFDPRWEELRANYGGTMGHHTAFVQAKANWLAHRLETGELDSPLARDCLARLQALWAEWAGYQLTAHDEFRCLLPD